MDSLEVNQQSNIYEAIYMFNLNKTEGYVNPNQVVSGGEVVVGNMSERLSFVNNKNNTDSYSDPVSSMADSKSTLELRYARYMSTKGCYRKRVEGDFTTLYKWTNTCWERVSKSNAKDMAWQWLKTNVRSHAKDSKVVSLHNSCMYDLPELGAMSETSLIPLQNCWLTLTKDNKLKIDSPDRTKGVTYHIKAKIDFSNGAEHYEPKALPEDSLFARFLATSLPDLKERALIQEYCGSTLLNDTRYQKAQVWVGNGGNGKSVLLNIISELHAKVGSLSLDRLKGFGLVPLVDSSLLISAETPKKGIDEQELKKIVTGDLLSVEYKNKDIFAYRSTGKLIVACNTFPQLNDDTDGVWRRLQIIRWGVSIPTEQQITDLENRLIKEELGLVVDWCLAGLLRLLNRGKFDEPESVIARKEVEKQNSDSIKVFVADYGLSLSTNVTIGKDELYKKYEDFCSKNCLYTASGPVFWKNLRSQFPSMVEQKKGTNGRRYRVVNLAISSMSNEDEPTPFDDMIGGV